MVLPDKLMGIFRVEELKGETARPEHEAALVHGAQLQVVQREQELLFFLLKTEAQGHKRRRERERETGEGEGVRTAAPHPSRLAHARTSSVLNQERSEALRTNQ
jgi:hypothetical protein